MQILSLCKLKAVTMVSQLSKCLKFKFIRGDKNDCILYKITPRNVTNFRHLLSCDTIEEICKLCKSCPQDLSVEARSNFYLI